MNNNPGKVPKQKPNKINLSRTLVLMAVCGVIAFIVLTVRLFKVQVIDHDEYETMALSQQVQDTTVTASRGTIYDTNGNVLAMSATAYSIFISPYEIQHYEEDVNLIADKLSELLGVDRETIIDKSKNTDSWYETIARKIEPELADQVREFKSENDLMGVHVEEDAKRYYPYGKMASQAIGFVGSDGYGLEGIEAVYDKYLEGVDGNIVRLRSADGTDILFQNYEYYYDAQDGDNLTLTLDVNIQNIVEKYLEQAIMDNDVLNGASAIVMDVDTGAVLAVASYENYDPNNYLEVSESVQSTIDAIEDEEEKSQALTNARYEQWRNKAISDTYEPGSVFKIITLAIGLEEGIVDESDSFYCGGSKAVLGREPVNCWKTTGHGSQTLAQAMQHSCNVALVDIGLQNGAELSWDYYEAFGLFDRTGIDLAGEAQSQWWTKEVFCDPNNYSQLAAASFGQTFNVTPLQMITAVSAVANGGYLLEPYIVDNITDSDGNVVMSNNKNVVRQVISEETSDRVCEILETVVSAEGGTGGNAYVPGYRIAGKTGTSEKTAQDAAGEEKEYMVSFCGFAPADAPEIAVLVVLDTPSPDTGLYISGGNMVAPVVGGIFSEALPYLGVEPQYSAEDLKNIDIAVPNVSGYTIEEASDIIRNAGFEVRVVGEGENVSGQLPAANVEVLAGSTVLIYADESTPDGTIAVPDVTGMTPQQAMEALEQRGLFMSSSGALATDDSVTVSRQSIESGAEVEYGSVVKVTLSNKSIQGQY